MYNFTNFFEPFIFEKRKKENVKKSSSGGAIRPDQTFQSEALAKTPSTLITPR
jgi:hypothetical protein